MRLVALDLAVRKTVLAEMVDGKVELKEFAAIDDALKYLGPQTTRAKVAFESCRQAWYVERRLREAGHVPVMVDTTRAKELGIGRHGRKNDEIDVVILLTALREDRLPVAHVLSEPRQQIRLQQNVRDMLVKTRAQLITSARQVAHAFGEQIKTGASDHFSEQLRASQLSDEAAAAIAPMKTLVEHLTKEIASVERKLSALAAKEPAVELLCSCPGVGLVVSMSFVSVIDDPKRFETAHEVESYLGLVPSERSSGKKRRLGSISKAGNSYLRSMLVQAAQSILRPGSRTTDPLRLWGQAVASKRGRKIAVVAIARRLAGILWAMWRDNRSYHAPTLAARSHRGLKKIEQTATERANAMKAAAKKLEANRRKWQQLQSREVA